MSVEPPITGFANAMRALCRIRQGKVDEGIALVHGPTASGSCATPDCLQLYNSLGALIEGYLWRGEWRLALEAAREGVAIPERGGDANSFFTGYNGHAAVRAVVPDAPRVAAAGGRGRRRPATRHRALAAGAPSPQELRQGREGVSGRARRRCSCSRGSRLRWRASAAGRGCVAPLPPIAAASSMPYEHAMATRELGRHADTAAKREPLPARGMRDVRAPGHAALRRRLRRARSLYPSCKGNEHQSQKEGRHHRCGPSALTAAYWLTSTEELRATYELTIYQMGWRLGGKGASGRNRAHADRIEEHGLHIIFGFYQKLLRDDSGSVRGHQAAIRRSARDMARRVHPLSAA